MNRPNKVPLNAVPAGGAPVYVQPSVRIPQDFREATLHIPVKLARHADSSASDRAAKTQPDRKRAVKGSAVQWKSSFKPVGEDDSLDQSTDSSQRVEMYDPYDPASSDSEHEMLHGKNHNNSSPDQDYNLEHEGSSPSRGYRKKRRWASCYSESVNVPLDVQDFSPETRPAQSSGLSPGSRPGYDSISRPPDHRVRSPDGLIHAASAKQFPASFRGQRTDGEEERILVSEYKREMNTAVRSSPTRSQQDYQQLNYLDTEWDRVPPSTKKSRNRSINIIMDKNPITCDLCDVELANSQELEDHLESKSHWDTLEHIQQQNNYDDLAIAFLQEVMLYKSQQCSRAINDGALQALQENDHMTKIEMFRCAACSVFVSTSASSVHIHITSQEHLTNIKEFQAQQRRSCLDKAETMMKELKPQFEHFLKGGSPFD
ncbi:DBIRD complex subunit ZNF326-like [Clinocottus analis]|uniref:DBIRD complex subunit ZNF326-like n=1 Tax=Clinocottus analis TaxID=304258 RepID=UPI0035BEC8D0